MVSAIEDWIALSLIPGIGPRRARMLLAQWGEPAAIFAAPLNELSVNGLTAESLNAIQSDQLRLQAREQYRQLQLMKASVITFADPAYPELLKQIADAPPVLYVSGTLAADFAAATAQPMIAIVGSRRCTSYGREATKLLTSELAAHGITIVSGLARGVDTVAHEAALNAGGQTIAVLGSGLDLIYPQENCLLANKIEQQGALVTELPLGSPPLPQNFPYRNRIIAGLCLGVLVVEAAERSGSLITARLALEQNREVFAVPGNITAPTSIGPNYLIKDGAKLVQSWRDVVEELPMNVKQQILGETEKTTATASTAVQQELFPHSDLSESEQKLYDLITVNTPQHIDQLSAATGLSSAALLSTLLALEVKDKIKQLPGKNFVRLR